jgi:hypothetical protein
VGHPIAWQAPITLRDLSHGVLDFVGGGAQAAGVTADALVLVDSDEHARRTRAGLAGVTSIGLLDAVLNFPLHTPVRICDIGQETVAAVRRAPAGVFHHDGTSITRLLSPPVTVVAALVTGVSWRHMMAEVGSFVPFCQQVMVLERVPRMLGSLAWEARLAGVGVWVDDGAEVVEVLQPQVFQRRRWKPAGWRFQERAYATWLRPTHRSTSWCAAENHPSRIGSGGSDPLEPVLPGM